MPTPTPAIKRELLRRLRDAWSRDPRAEGGLQALAGFDYQFILFLWRLIEKWSQLPSGKRYRASIFTEYLSDIVDTEGADAIVVAQVKTTQSSNGVKKALDELWEVYQLACRETPELISSLEFLIVSQRAEIKDVSAAIRRWRPLRSNGLRVTRFRKMVRSEIVENPRTQVLESLAGTFGVSDPQGVLQRWLGMLLDAGDSAGFRRVAEDIWNELWRLSQPSVVATRRRVVGIAPSIEASDIRAIQTPDRFRSFCLRLFQRLRPDLITFGSRERDDGRDISWMTTLDYSQQILVSCEFFPGRLPSSLGATDDAITAFEGDHPSIRQLSAPSAQRALLLCAAEEPSAEYAEALGELATAHGLDWELWGPDRLAGYLGSHPAVRDEYFYHLHDGLRASFHTETLQLASVDLDPECEWRQWDDDALYLSRKGNTYSPDLLLDVVIFNHGPQQTVLSKIRADVMDVARKAWGVPQDPLLISKVTYDLPIGKGKPGRYQAPCNPGLIIEAGQHQRFKIRLTETGYGWRGYMKIAIRYGVGRWLEFPFLRVAT